MVGQTPPRHVRIVACIIWFLSRRPDLGAAYILARRRRYDLSEYDLTVRGAVALLLSSYLDDERTVADVEAALAALDHKHRIVADTFLMHTVLVEHVIAQNKKGIVLDLDQVITLYIRLWACRPMADVVERRLSRLVWNRNQRRRFGVNLRREWALTLSTFSAPRELLPHEIRRRAFK